MNKLISKKIFSILTILSILVASGISAAIFMGLDRFLHSFAKASDPVPAENMSMIVQWFTLASHNFYMWVLPAVFGFILVAGWAVWLILKAGLSQTILTFQADSGLDGASGKKKKDFIDQKIEQERKQRLYLHTLSVFQREGRLLDFFDEDLNTYDDEQIGAAVRSIQEDCKKAVKKYIDPKPVIDSEEGQKVVVEKDFDIDAVKLIGNVSGEPPFEGVLNHRGWKAGKREIPKLSDIQDSSIIMPAEVEIQ